MSRAWYERCCNCSHGNRAHVDGAVCEVEMRAFGGARCACSHYDTVETRYARTQASMADAVRRLGEYQRAVDKLVGVISASNVKLPDEITAAAHAVVVAADAG